MKRIIPAIIGILLLSGGFSPVYGDSDVDTFMVRVDPNILIIFDNSGSMRTISFHSGYNPSTVYSGNIKDWYGKLPGQAGYDPTNFWQLSSGNYIPADFPSSAGSSPSVYLRGGDADLLSSGIHYVRYPVNYLNWIFFHTTSTELSSLPISTRMEVAKLVVKNYINGASDVRLGLMRFNLDWEDGGGTIISAINDITASYKTSLINSLNAIGPDTNTPLAGSLSEAWRYFSGDSKCYGGSGKYKSPIQYWCQKNFVVIITDGEPSEDSMNKTCAAPPAKSNWDNDSEVEEPPVSRYRYRYLDDIAYYMYNNDARSNLDDTQNVYTYTIGFTIQSQLLEDTAANGHGLYLTSDNASELATALDSAIADIIERSYSFTSPTVPSLMASGGDVLYQASFEPSDEAFWKGHLYAYSIDSSGNIADTPLWDAGEELLKLAADDRTIYTVINGGLVEFNINNIFLTFAHLGVADDTERDKLISYVRGIDSYDDNGDGDTTDQRSWKLGDIFHSGPVIVGAPKRFYFDYGYSGTGEFYETYKDRTKIILAGANDGMLHAFQASNGEELWAFIPPNLLSRLKYMRTAHTFFVDLPVRVEDVWFGAGDSTGKIATSKTWDEWHTIAVVGERQGGNQFNALDITDTTSPSWLWSFGSSDDPLDETWGETWGRPAINRVNIDDNEVWVVIMSGGYDSAGEKGNALYIVNAQYGTNMNEQAGTSIYCYTSMDGSAPAPPYAVDINVDGFIDRIYLGDLGGNMYRFYVHDKYTCMWSESKLFDASGGPIRPVYTQAVGSFDTDNYFWIYFGTGDKSDPTAPNAQEKFFAIKETTTGDCPCPYNVSNCKSCNIDDLKNYTKLSGELTDKYGWYINMTGHGEKILSPPTVFGGVVYFTSYTPSQSANPCDAGGSSTLYAVGYTSAAGQLGDDSRTLSLGDGMASAPIVSVSRDSCTGQLSGSVFVNTSTGGFQNTNVNPNIPSSLVDYIYWKDMRIGE